MAQSTNNRSQVDRRAFVKAIGGVSALAALGGGRLSAGLFAGPSPSSAAETAVTEFYKTLSESQKGQICFGFNHQLRNRINANWNITKPEIGDDFYTDKQRQLIEQIFRGMTSEDGYKTLKHQMADDSGSINSYSVAVFGEPGNGDFEFELTGRHLTLRADGNSVDKAAFGGPIVYGHGIEEPKENVFYNQTVQTNKVFQALDAAQAEKALVKTKIPAETAVQIQGEGGNFPGISVADLTSDQKVLVEETLSFLLAPFREEDRAEVMEIVKESGGVEKLNMAFFQNGDLGSDKVWDVWRVEGPSFVWHFRGAPHVHAYINIGHKKA
ncbi:MAG: DUF3500 domain-containing protein [Fuerstiella sp.]|jgi:hypothetical protein